MFLKGGYLQKSIPNIAVLGILLLLCGCASYSQSFNSIEQSLLRNDPANALKQLEKQSHSDSDLFLYYSDRAILLRMLGKFRESNKNIEQAKAIIEKYSAISISEQTSSFIINDSTQTYIGTPVEQIMLNIYAALNYLEMSERDSARVEVLQADIRLRTLMQDDPDSPLSVDPFARYLAGVIYEDLGEWSDAMIAYRKAYEAYQRHSTLYEINIPQQLKRSLIKMADKVGLDNERQKYESEFNLQLSQFQQQNQNNAELIFTFQNGLAPIKRESSVTVMEPSTGQLIRVSLPRYEKRDPTVNKVRLIIKNKNEFVTLTEKVEDISSLEIASLDAQMGAITARALARAVAKHEISKQAGRRNDLAGLITNIAGLVTERADTRSWLTLPTEIQTARLRAPADTYSVNIELLDKNGNIIYLRTLGKIKLSNEHKYYLSFHWAAATRTTRH